MRRPGLFLSFALTAVAALALPAAASAAPAIAPKTELKTPFGALRAHAPASGVTAGATATGVVARNFRVLGHNDLGAQGEFNWSSQHLDVRSCDAGAGLASAG